MPKAQSSLKLGSRLLTLAGNTLLFLGGIGLVLGMLGLYNMDIFAFGLSSGVRIVGTVAIAGCLLSAIGYGISDYINK
jgi:hypothetical protein